MVFQQVAPVTGERAAGGGRTVVIVDGSMPEKLPWVQEQRNVADPILQTGKGPFMKTPGGRESGQICSRLRSRRDGRVWKLAWNNSRSLARARV